MSPYRCLGRAAVAYQWRWPARAAWCASTTVLYRNAGTPCWPKLRSENPICESMLSETSYRRRQAR